MANRTNNERTYIAGIDVGGTFTDLLLVGRDGRPVLEKVLSNPADIAASVLAVLEKAEHGLSLDQPLVRSVSRLVHGATVAANAFLERKGARLAFLTTKGTRDTLVMRRMYREDMYDTRSGEPPPLVTRDNVLEVEERVDHNGKVVTPLNERDVELAVKQMKARGIDSVGICYLFSFRNPSHELRTKEIIREHLPDIPISTSYEVCPEIRDFERASTTHLNAYLQPPVEKYLRNLDMALRRRRASASLQVMHSYGGVTNAQEAADKPVNLLLSGPAGGVIGSAFLGKRAGFPNIISFDMGGTSCDISLVRNATPSLSTPINATSTHCKFEGWDVLIPFIDIHTIGSGGGSVAWIDQGGGVHIGPESMGADPGPACYDAGGQEATVTDADVVLGYINPDYYLGGQIRLNRAKAEEAIGRLAKRIELSPIEAADGVFRIINTNMLNGIRVVSVEKGHDPRNFALLSFGGAGGVHATTIIEQLEIDRVIIPETASAFSAFGLLCTDLRRDYVTTVYRRLSQIKDTEIRATLRTMEKEGRRGFGARQAKGAKRWSEYFADMRYAGQGHDIRVHLEGPLDTLTRKKITNRFNKAYRLAYGYLEDEANIQLVNLRVVACLATEKPRVVRQAEKARAAPARFRKGTRDVYFTEHGKFVPTSVYDGHALGPGNRLKGPAVVELATTTAVLRPGQNMRVDPYGNFIVARRGVRA